MAITRVSGLALRIRVAASMLLNSGSDISTTAIAGHSDVTLSINS